MKNNNFQNYINEIKVEEYSHEEVQNIIKKGKSVKRKNKSITISLCIMLVVAVISITSILLFNKKDDDNISITQIAKEDTINTIYVSFNNSLYDIDVQPEKIIIKEKLEEYFEKNEPVSKYIVEKDNGEREAVYFYFGLFDTNELAKIDSIKDEVDLSYNKTEIISKRYSIEHIPEVNSELEVMIQEVEGKSYIIEIK